VSSILTRFDGEMLRAGPPRSHELQRIARFGVALLGMFAVAPASAQNSTRDLTLTWDAPRECPDRGAVLAEIAKHLREERKFPDDWFVQARVVRKPAQFELELTLRRGGGEPARRTLGAASCAPLVEATAVFVALAIDSQPSAAESSTVEVGTPEPVSSPKPNTGPNTGGGSNEPGSRGPAAIEPSATRASSEQTAPSTTAVQAASQTPLEQSHKSATEVAPAAVGGRRQPLRIGVGIGVGVRLDAGMLPGPRSGPQAWIDLRLLRLRVALGLAWLPPIETIAEAYPDAIIRASGLLGDAALGYAVLAGRFSLLPCVRLEYGRLSLASRGIEAPDAQSIHWAAAGAGARAAYRIAAGFELGFEAAGLAPFSRPRSWLRTDRGDLTLFHAAAVAVRVSASIAYVFE
jgi:hypothetical protein